MVLKGKEKSHKPGEVAYPVSMNNFFLIIMNEFPFYSKFMSIEIHSSHRDFILCNINFL